MLIAIAALVLFLISAIAIRQIDILRHPVVYISGDTTQESYFNDFYVVGDKVYFDCIITFKNRTPYQKEINISARSYKDYQAGLITTADLSTYGVLPEDVVFTSKTDFINKIITPAPGKSILEPFVPLTISGGKMKTCRLIFIGNFGGNPQKADRTLPAISIDVVK